MQKLKIKDSYQGLIITRKSFILGQLTFDPNNIKEEDYKNYYINGFEDVFEWVPDEQEEILKDIILENGDELEIKVKKPTNKKTKK